MVGVRVPRLLAATPSRLRPRMQRWRWLSDTGLVLPRDLCTVERQHRMVFVVVYILITSPKISSHIINDLCEYSISAMAD